MADKYTLECFLSMIDEAERIAVSDRLADRIPVKSYTIEAKKEKTAFDYREASSCFSCPCFRNRRVFASPELREGSKVLFIAPSPEGDTVFTPESYSMFSRWRKALGLGSRDTSLSTLVKCPSASFSQEHASACKGYLREEMKASSPCLLVLLGRDTASYMLRQDGEIDSMRLKLFRINGIPSIVTYTPAECAASDAVRAKVGKDLFFIKKTLESL